MTDLLKIGTSALMGNQAGLQTTSNNIANLNTPGYTRQRTEFSSFVEWGVGRPETVRLFDRYAVEQLRRDTSTASYNKSLAENNSVLDNQFADQNTSIAKGLDDVFVRLNEANDEPTAVTPRQLVISDAEAMVARMQGMSERILEQEDVVNEEIYLKLGETNSVLASILDVNERIISSVSTTGNNSASPELLDERNELIRTLSETMAISTIDQADGSVMVNTKTGQPLVLSDSYFKLSTTIGDPDPQRLDVELTNSKNTSQNIPFDEDNIGGELGGLFDYRKDVLDEAVNSLGQLAIAFADSMNEQNKKGVTLDGDLGGDVFNIPSTKALGYQDNSSSFHEIEVRIEQGLGSQVSNFDYQMEFTSPTEYTLQAVQAGELTGGVSGPFTIPALTTDFQGSSNVPPLPDGIEMRFDPDTAFATGDQFLIRPTRLAGLEIEMNLSRPEELALAAPVQLENPITNLGNAQITLENVTNTETSNAALNESAFTDDVNGDTITGDYGLDADAPAKIVYTLAGQYEVQDSAGGVIATVASGDNIMDQVRQLGGTPWPNGTHGSDYPGYEISIEGTPKAGDEFNIGYNETGLDDNYNGLKLADLQSADTMRRNIVDTGSNTLTFAESYSNLVGFIGEQANRSEIDYNSSVTLLEQSQQRVDDMSGINLD